MRIINDWKAFLAFLKQPEYLSKNEGILSKSILTINSFILKILIVIPLVIAFILYTYFSGDVLKTNLENVTNLYHPIILFTMVAIYEEVSFRGFLTKFNPILFSISITGIIAVYVKKIVFLNMMWEQEGLMEIGILILILFPILFLLSKKHYNALDQFWERNFTLVFYLSVFLFAFVHFFNSTDWSLSYLKTNIFQLISGLILGFVRIRAGLVYAIILHFIWDMML